MTSTVREEVERRAHLTEPYTPPPRPCPGTAAEAKWVKWWGTWAADRRERARGADRHEEAGL